jgi:hypothetical protein
VLPQNVEAGETLLSDQYQINSQHFYERGDGNYHLAMWVGDPTQGRRVGTSAQRVHPVHVHAVTDRTVTVGMATTFNTDATRPYNVKKAGAFAEDVLAQKRIRVAERLKRGGPLGNHVHCHGRAIRASLRRYTFANAEELRRVYGPKARADQLRRCQMYALLELPRASIRRGTGLHAHVVAFLARDHPSPPSYASDEAITALAPRSLSANPPPADVDPNPTAEAPAAAVVAAAPPPPAAVVAAVAALPATVTTATSAAAAASPTAPAPTAAVAAPAVVAAAAPAPPTITITVKRRRLS